MKEHHISEPRINDRIRVPEVRLVGPNGEQVGIVRVEDALRLAQEADLDLVEVAPQARPPVCKLMDFGKFKYEADMKAREARKNQAHTVLKEIRLRLKIDPHDYGTKKGHVERFLNQGDKVKVMIMFRGREQSRPEMGYRLLQRMAADVAELGYVESSPKQDGRNMIMVIGPLKKKADVKAEQKSTRPVRVRDDADLDADLESDDIQDDATVTADDATPAPAASAPAAPAPTAPAVGADDDEPIFTRRDPSAPRTPALSRPVSSAPPRSGPSSSRPPSSRPPMTSRPAGSSPSGAPSSGAPSSYPSRPPASGSRPSTAPAGPRPPASARPAPAGRPAPAPGAARPAPSAPGTPAATPGAGAQPAPRPTPAARPTPGPAAKPGPAPRPGPRPAAAAPKDESASSSARSTEAAADA
jgi:translation initiation factor IF-3